jgi:hypothetical protein
VWQNIGPGGTTSGFFQPPQFPLEKQPDFHIYAVIICTLERFVRVPQNGRFSVNYARGYLSQ